MLDFTQEITLSSDCLDLNLLIREGTDLDDTFKAWCLDEKEFIKVNGWLFSIVEEQGERYYDALFDPYF